MKGSANRSKLGDNRHGGSKGRFLSNPLPRHSSSLGKDHHCAMSSLLISSKSMRLIRMSSTSSLPATSGISEREKCAREQNDENVFGGTKSSHPLAPLYPPLRLGALWTQGVVWLCSSTHQLMAGAAPRPVNEQNCSSGSSGSSNEKKEKGQAATTTAFRN